MAKVGNLCRVCRVCSHFVYNGKCKKNELCIRGYTPNRYTPYTPYTDTVKVRLIWLHQPNQLTLY